VLTLALLGAVAFAGSRSAVGGTGLRRALSTDPSDARG
jgi:hypothetical protein